MSMNGSVDQRRGQSSASAVLVPAEALQMRLDPSMEHKPDNCDDLPLEFSPFLFSYLKRYLLPSMLTAPRDTKVDHMREILLTYSPKARRIKKQKDYRLKILTNYQVELLKSGSTTRV